MKKSNLILAFLLTIAGCVFSQSKVFDVSFEFQAYPTGLIPGLRLEKGFAEKNAVSLRLGYQFIDHRDLGKHDDETGSGFGFTLGYKRYFNEGFQGFFAGVRNDIWWNQIDWLNSDPEESSTTDIVVVQPTAEVGYQYAFDSGWVLSPTLSFGFEVNVKTDGQPTGEGAIVLLGVNVGRRF